MSEQMYVNLKQLRDFPQYMAAIQPTARQLNPIVSNAGIFIFYDIFGILMSV